MGNAAQEEVIIKPFLILKRGPDLSVCDYAFWKAINHKMRAQEQARDPRRLYASLAARSHEHVQGVHRKEHWGHAAPLSAPVRRQGRPL